jgi:hypothetical protein
MSKAPWAARYWFASRVCIEGVPQRLQLQFVLERDEDRTIVVNLDRDECEQLQASLASWIAIEKETTP